MTSRILAAAISVFLTSGRSRRRCPRRRMRCWPWPPPRDWQALDPAKRFTWICPNGRVVILLASGFAPKTVANIKGWSARNISTTAPLSASQDNYVVQWSQEDNAEKTAKAKLKGYAEFERPALNVSGAPARSRHLCTEDRFRRRFSRRQRRQESNGCCIAMECVGAGRDNAADSGSGVELYAVTGQAPRQLDRNISLVGRVVQGMELLSSLPRGGNAQGAYMGFYQSPSQYTKINGHPSGIGTGAQGPAPEDGISSRPARRLSRLMSKPAAIATMTGLCDPAGAIDACNIPLPVRTAPN